MRQCSQDGSRVSQIRSGDSQRSKDFCKDCAIEESARQRHVLGVHEHPAIRRQLHQVGGTGTPRTPLLPDKASEVVRLLQAFRGYTLEMISRNQRKVHEARAATFHLLGSYPRVRRLNQARREWTRFMHLRRGGVHAGKYTSQYEQGEKKHLRPRSGKCSGFHA